MRGEYPLSCYKPTGFAELPPRARRILNCGRGLVLENGTTSACAENTAKSVLAANHHRNYLRVRGEYMTAIQAVGPAEELPPRARRIPFISNADSPSYGTTSACAENTPLTDEGFLGDRNYLRVRGEYLVKITDFFLR